MEPKATKGYSGMWAKLLEKQLTSQLADADLAYSPNHLDVLDATKYAANKYYPVETPVENKTPEGTELEVDWDTISEVFKQLPIMDAESELARHLASQLPYQWMMQESAEPDYQYECVDDFTIGDYFSIGCVYTGHRWVGDEERLELLDDTGKARIVPAENFKFVA